MWCGKRAAGGRLQRSMSNSHPSTRQPSGPLPDGVETLRLGEDAYPKLLAEIDAPPERLHVWGELPAEPAIAMVGSRACTAYGRRVAYRLALQVARCGFPVVSGLARGVDAAAHTGALDGDGHTVAVIPTGLDTIYPATHTNLARRIARRGAVVTEYEPGTRVHAGNFHRRNRIIAGLAVATVVVEAAHKSGTKITVKFALANNRDVLAVPGPIDSPTSAGANELLAEGAAPCTGIESLLAHLPVWARQRAARRLDDARDEATALESDLSATARAILEAIPRHTSRGVDQLAAATGLPVNELLAALTDIESRGLIRSVGGQRYERNLSRL